MRFILILLSVVFSTLTYGKDIPVIAVASNMQFAMQEIADSFLKSTGKSVRISYGSSGNFYRQILQGAPFELFLSADETYINKLVEKNKTEDAGQIYALGRLVLFAPNDSPLDPKEGIESLHRQIDAKKIVRFSIANPEHAPYGQAARQVLRAQQLWEKIQPTLVLGENAGQATQFTVSGSTQGGIIPYALALSANIEGKGSFALLPSEWHLPLVQRMVLLKNADETCRKFYDYLASEESQDILKRYGFEIPAATKH